jgi:hypothetical protein
VRIVFVYFLILLILPIWHVVFGQQCGGSEFKALYAIFNIHLDMCGLLSRLVWMELLLLRRRRLYLPCIGDSLG